MNLRPAVIYTVLRVLAFLVPLGILLLFPVFRQFPFVAAVVAAAIGWSISMLWLRRPRDEMSREISARRAERAAARKGPTDEEVEDVADDASRSINERPPTD